MNARQLIEILKQIPPETPIFIKGYEGGLDDAKKTSMEVVSLNVHTESYLGDHDYYDNCYKGKEKVNGLLIQ